jgi:peptide/nickel transport system substrate-binding protein
MHRRHVAQLGVVAVGAALVSLLVIGGASGRVATHHAAPTKTLTVSYPAGSWPALDPSVAFSSENDVLTQVYETLTRYNPATRKVVPDLALSWSHNRNGKVWTFNLRPHVKFQDGSKFTAAAVKFTVNRTKTLNKGAAYIWDAVKKVNVVSPLKVKFILSSPRPLDLVASAAWGGFMLSPKSDKQKSSWFQSGRGVGTGPYMWKSYTPGQSAVLKRFPGYWGGWKSNQFSSIVYNLSADATTRQAQLISGTSQVAQYLGYSQIKSLARRSGLKIHSLDVTGIYYLAFNTSKAPLTNVSVRQALAYSFPHAQVMKAVYGKFAPAENHNLIPRGMWGYKKLKGYSFNLAKAKQLLAKAGHPNGGFTIDMAYIANYPQDAEIGQLWQPILKKLGIKLNLTQISLDTWLTDCCSAPKTGPSIMTANWPPTYPTPYDYLFSNWGTGGPGGNGSYYHSKRNDRLLAKGLVQSATNRKKAAATFAKVESDILTKAATIPLVDYPMNVAAVSQIKGFSSRCATLWMYGLHT